VIDAVFQAELEVGLAEPLKKSVSIGLACVRLEADSIASEIIERADNALYSAKQAGRNRMIVAPSESLSQRIE